MTDRRSFLAGVAAVLAAPFALEAQQSTIPRVGVIAAVTRDAQIPFADAFREGLRTAGYVEGRNIAVEWQYTDGRAERFAEAAVELVRLKVDLIVAANNPAVAAALTATKTIPIVMVLGLDPVGLGFVASLARPGGTITGFSAYLPELVGKRLQFLKEVAPNALEWRSSGIPI